MIGPVVFWVGSPNLLIAHTAKKVFSALKESTASKDGVSDRSLAGS
jgi:hypothetical protein